MDLRLALRRLRRAPAFTLMAAAILALGMSASTTVFSVFHALLWKPLPFPEADRLVAVTGVVNGQAGAPTSIQDFQEWERRSSSFAAMAAMFYEQNVNLAGSSGPERIVALPVSGRFFEALGIAPELGRGISAEEARPGGAAVVVLSHGLWKRRFGGDGGWVGRDVELNGVRHRVIGVMPARFGYPEGAEAWTPMTIDPARWPRAAHILRVIARLKPGVSVEEASAEMAAVARGIAERNPATNREWGAAAMPLGERMTGRVRAALYALMGSAGLLLLIGVANVAGLLLSRAAAREREAAICTLLGAGWGRVAGQLALESGLLAALGGAAGVTASIWLIDGARVLGSGVLPRSDEIRLSWAALGFAAAATAGSALLFGLAPAARLGRRRLAAAIQSGGRGLTGGAGQRARAALVVGELALSVVLLTGAGLLIQSFVELRRVSPGFDADNVLAASLSLSAPGYREPKDALSFYGRLLERVRALPGVEAASMARTLPFTGEQPFVPFRIEGAPPLEPGIEQRADLQTADREYLRVMRIPLRRGRWFEAGDRFAGPPVAVINEAFARRFFPNQDPLGKRIASLGVRPMEIVGVVGDVRRRSLEQPAGPEIYLNCEQQPVVAMTLVVRSGNAAGQAAALAKLVSELDPGIPLFDVRPVTEVVAGTVSGRRMSLLLLGSFAALATALAGAGIYGVVSYMVGQRTAEFGLRMALGARSGDLLRMVMGQGARLAALGIGLGLAGAAIAVRAFSRLLYGVTPLDPAAYALAAAALAAVALAACWIPARRAMAVDPNVALRYE